MRFHLFGLATVPCSPEFTVSPFNTLTVNMAKMVKRAGHHLTLYAPAGSTAPCDEFVELVSKETLSLRYPNKQVTPDGVPFVNVAENDEWKEFTERGMDEFSARHRTGDVALISFGNIQRWVADIAPLHVEFCCGYSGIFSGCRVFPSKACQHLLYGWMGQGNTMGGWHDAVIPHYLDKDEFVPSYAQGKYLLSIGRLTPDKGTDIAIDIARRAGIDILVAGGECGFIPDFLKAFEHLPGVRFLGRVGHEERVRLMRGAIALLSPCRYIETFGMTTIEALACGTPVIGPEFGAFPEIIEDGKTGFICHDMAEFRDAIKAAPSLSREACRKSFEDRFSLEVVWPQYDRLIHRVAKRMDEGWYGLQDGWRGTSIDALLRDLGDVGQTTIVEVGVGSGELSQYILTANPSATLIMVDSWKVAPHTSEYRKSGDGCSIRSLRDVLADRAMAVERTKFADGRHVIVNGDSIVAAEKLSGSAHLVFLDADHSFRAVCADIEAWWPKVKPGGFLAGHDYDNPQKGCEGVKDAVLQFSQRVGLPVRREAGWVWAIQKPAPEGPIGPAGPPNESGITASAQTETPGG